MTGRRSKVIKIVVVLVALTALVFFLQGGQFNRSFTDFMDVSTMRFMMLGLVGVVALQAVGLYILARRPNADVLTGYVMPNKPFMSEQRGRGRPRKPCNFALMGVLSCPLEPNLELDPDFVAKLSIAVADYQHEKLRTPESPNKKLDDLEAETAPKHMLEEPDEKPAEQKEATKKGEAPQGESKEGVGELVVEMAEVLSRKTSLKSEKKEDKVSGK